MSDNKTPVQFQFSASQSHNAMNSFSRIVIWYFNQTATCALTLPVFHSSWPIVIYLVVICYIHCILAAPAPLGWEPATLCCEEVIETDGKITFSVFAPRLLRGWHQIRLSSPDCGSQYHTMPLLSWIFTQRPQWTIFGTRPRPFHVLRWHRNAVSCVMSFRATWDLRNNPLQQQFYCAIAPYYL